MHSLIIVLALMTAVPASAQTWPQGPRPTLADRHRYETERLRQRSRDQADFARWNQLNARLTEREVRAARAAEPYQRLEPSLPASPEAARRAREAATARREATVAGVTQIDDWLDRRPR